MKRADMAIGLSSAHSESGRLFSQGSLHGQLLLSPSPTSLADPELLLFLSLRFCPLESRPCPVALYDSVVTGLPHLSDGLWPFQGTSQIEVREIHGSQAGGLYRDTRQLFWDEASGLERAQADG